jgi:hypothetical protein
MGGEEGGEILGEKLHDRGEIGEHADMTAHALRIFRQLDRDLLDIEQCQASVMQERLSRRRQRHAFCEPLEQCDAEGELEIGHPLGDGGGRDAFAVGRLGEVLLLADCDEQAERRQVDASEQRAFGRADVALAQRCVGVVVFERHEQRPEVGDPQTLAPTIA